MHYKPITISCWTGTQNTPNTLQILPAEFQIIHKAKATPESQCPVWFPTVPKQKSDVLQAETLKESLVEDEKKIMINETFWKQIAIIQ